MSPSLVVALQTFRYSPQVVHGISLPVNPLPGSSLLAQAVEAQEVAEAQLLPIVEVDLVVEQAQWLFESLLFHSLQLQKLLP